ncbi:MAG: SGNH/GDSL hydrolase family protein [Pseudolabrys sp.]
MTGRVLLSLALLALAAPANSQNLAQHQAECRVADQQIERDFPLPRVARALGAKRLDILVVGAGSSLLPGPSGPKNAYPARLQIALAEKLPSVAVKVTTDVTARRTAAEMVTTMAPALAAAKPTLMVWQTGTVDAMQSIDTDQFRAALESGINIAHAAGADVVLINSQYSPRTESMIALGTYAENMRWVALQQEVPLFDRFSIMKLWADLGTFDLYSATKKLDMAERVHDCIGRLLADFVIEAAKPEEPHAEPGR